LRRQVDGKRHLALAAFGEMAVALVVAVEHFVARNQGGGLAHDVLSQLNSIKRRFYHSTMPV
jgi:hypothetical protein